MCSRPASAGTHPPVGDRLLHVARLLAQVPYSAFGREDEGDDDFSTSRSRLRDVQNDVDEVRACIVCVGACGVPSCALRSLGRIFGGP
jgi:predicted secreted protein